MRGLFDEDSVAVFDLSNVVARALSVAKEDYISLLLKMLLRYRHELSNRRFVFAVEGNGTKRRQQIYSGYKEGRQSTEDFHKARKDARKILSYCNCELIRASDGEADDAIATYVHQTHNANILIVSNDRDLWQHIGPKVRVRAKVKGKALHVDPNACKSFLGVDPQNIPFMKALLGDSSDNIPRGVPRIKKALLIRLAQEAGDVRNLDNAVAEADWLNKNEKDRIISCKDSIVRNEMLTRSWNYLTLQKKQYRGDAEGLVIAAKNMNTNVSKSDAATIAGEMQ